MSEVLLSSVVCQDDILRSRHLLFVVWNNLFVSYMYILAQSL